MHGAAVRVLAADTAFAARGPQWDFDVIGLWEDPTESTLHIQWVRDVWAQMPPLMPRRAYLPSVDKGHPEGAPHAMDIALAHDARIFAHRGRVRGSVDIAAASLAEP